MPVVFTPIEAVVVNAINQDEFKDFSYQNPFWGCLERGELPKDDVYDGRRALRDDLPVNLKQPLPMTPILSHQSSPDETVWSTITVVKTDHTPIPHTEIKRTPTSAQFQPLHISPPATPLQASTSAPTAISNLAINTQNKSPSTNRSNKIMIDQTDM